LFIDAYLSNHLDSGEVKLKAAGRYGSLYPIKYGAKREFGAAKANTGAAPATVSGEPRSN
jgi:hypothetical protein